MKGRRGYRREADSCEVYRYYDLHASAVETLNFM